MRRYLELWLSFLRMSWMADIEYRVNIVIRVVSELVWYTMQLSVFEVLYTHTDSISGWSVHEMRVFMGSLFVSDVIFMILFHENMDHFWSIIRKGDLDLYLTKPVNSQFMVSCRKISVSYFVNLLLVTGYLLWAISNLDRPVSVAAMFTYPLLILSGVVIGYALRFMFLTLIVVLQDAGNVQFIWYQLFRLATRPDPIYPAALRMLVLTILPLAFLASVPSRMLVDGLDWRYLLLSPALAAMLLMLSARAWRSALRRYASASS